jgi:hypothetical protein
MQRGRITGELSGEGATEEQVLALAMAEHLTASTSGGVPADLAAEGQAR